MPPRLPRLPIGLSRSCRIPITPRRQSTCLFHLLARPLDANTHTKRPLRTQSQFRKQSNEATSSGTLSRKVQKLSSSRNELRAALLDLQKDHSNFVNLARIQLAIRGLQQRAGEETIRIAVLALADVGASFNKAKELLRILLADPLKPDAEWESQLLNHQQGDRPLLIKVGHNGGEQSGPTNNLLEELDLSSPTLSGQKLEILLLELDPGSITEDAETVLAPMVNIPISNTGRFSTIGIPVHRALVVGDGILGAATLFSGRDRYDKKTVALAVDLQTSSESKTGLPLLTMDTSLGTAALSSLREDAQNAKYYEHHWFASGVPEILQWFKAETEDKTAMKSSVRSLIKSVLVIVQQRIENSRARQLDTALSAKISFSNLDSLKSDLAKWAERAHYELRNQLDIAFEGSPYCEHREEFDIIVSRSKWSKLGWWKLFWRVDDVSMIATDILSQRYLQTAEREIVYLAGIMAGKGVFEDAPRMPQKDWVYMPFEERFDAPPFIEKVEREEASPKIHTQFLPWPLHIPSSRVALMSRTIPALQALAQKLLVQCLSASAISSILAGLLYVSSSATGLYEAGAVATLGIVWSLRRLQKEWEKARKFWEGEVREEGRKAVRGVEMVVGRALKQTDRPLKDAAELEEAINAVDRARSALDRCK